MGTSFWLATIIFSFTFLLILTEKMHRTVIAMVGAVIMVLAGKFLAFYSGEQALRAIDFNTIGLLLGMMIIVVVLEKTGFFQYLAIWTAKKTKGNPWLLVVFLGTITTLVSCILNNVTTVILIAPVTIIMARILEISPLPILMAEALLSNIGGVATLIGDPPNIMIGSAAHFTFNDFLLKMGPVVVAAWLATLLTLKFVFKKELSQKPRHVEELLKMDEKKALKDKKTLKKVGIVLLLVMALFFLQGTFSLSPALVALLGAALTLILVAPQEDPQPVLEKVEWSVLLFFASLFVIIGGLEAAGVLKEVSLGLGHLIGHNVIIAALIILWISALMSAVVDNIPFTVAMLPIIQYLGTQGIPINILWWALALGVGFGGNGTPIGSSSNVVIVAKSEQTETPINLKIWLKAGFTSMVVTVLVASILLASFASYFSAPTLGQKQKKQINEKALSVAPHFLTNKF